MKSNQFTIKFPWKHLIPATLIIGLTACGDDLSLDSITGNTNPNDNFTMAVIAAPTGAASGVLMGTQAAGISYSSSSGQSGVTDEDGTFNFNHGDTVEFKLGDLILGKVQGSPVVTPIELAGDNENKLQNLLVLLHSLDSDGDPSNGISITDETAAAVDKSINLTGDPDKFASTANLQQIIDDSGIDSTVKTTEEATDHFLSQSTSIFSGNVWIHYNNSVAGMIRVASDGSGEYLHGQASPDDSCNRNRVCAGLIIYRAGVEYGVASASDVNTRGFILKGETIVDTNLRAGLSDSSLETRMSSDGYELVLSDIVNVQMEREQPSVFSEIFHIGGASSTVRARSDVAPETEIEEKRFKRVENDPNGIAGAWVYDTDTINTRTLAFLPDGKFFMADPTGEMQREEQAECARPGVEYASYTYNQGSNELRLTAFTYNTDGCIGLSSLESNAVHKFTIDADGESAVLEQTGDEPVTVYRVTG